MKPILTVIGVLALLGANLFAGPETIIKERAKQLRDENNARQGVPPTPRLPPPAGGPAAPATPALSPALVKFQTDLASFRAGGQITDEQKKALTTNLVVAAAGFGKPSHQSAAKLVDDLAAACSEKALPAASRTRLAMELDAVLNPAKYPQAKPEGIFSDIQTMFLDNGVERSKAAAIAEDVKTISAEVQRR